MPGPAVGLGLIASSPLTCVLLIIAWRRISARTAQRVALCALGLSGLGMFALLPYAGYTLPIRIEWLPGTGQMEIGLDATGLYAALATTWSAFLAALATRRENNVGSTLSPVLTLSALTAANVAFLSRHFLGRYLALEIVALSVALAPLIEVRGLDGGRLSTSVYLLLRIGDAGLLAGILILMQAGNTLEIASALESGKALDWGRRTWVLAGFLLATWVKIGVWPLHLWLQAGRQLALDTRTWLFATLMPNLGMYLLYRVTPLLFLGGPFQVVTRWLGAGSALMAMFLALTLRSSSKPRGLHAGLIYMGSAQGSLALLLSASGQNALVWLGLLLLTPLRLLLHVAADTAAKGEPLVRKFSASLFALGGLATAAYTFLAAGWAREAIGHPVAVLLIETTAACMVFWTVRWTWALLSIPHCADLEPEGGPASPARVRSKHPGARPSRALHWPRWVAMGTLTLCFVAGAAAWQPLARHLSAVSSLSLPNRITWEDLVPTAPAMLFVVPLIGVFWLFGKWQDTPDLQREEQPETDRARYGLQDGLAQAAKALQGVVERGVQDRILVWIVRAVIDSAQWTYRAMEQRFLGGLQRHTVEAVATTGRIAYRVIEHKGLEGFLRQVPQSMQSLSRQLQRLASGKLRRNLVWVTICLIGAVLALAFYAK